MLHDWDYVRGSRLNGRWKYGLQHDQECTCSLCLSIMEQHRRYNGGECFCESCRETRKRLQLIADTEELGKHKTKLEEIPVATINICDRPECGAMGKSGVMGGFEIYTGGDNAGERITGHLCPACVGELVTWWESTVADRQRAYNKAWERPSKAGYDAMTSAQLMQLALEKGREEVESL